MSFNARLISRHGSAARDFPLSRTVTVIGREPINDVVLNDSEISRRHARITFQGGIYSIEDLGSTNGTFVNEQRVYQPTPLASGDDVDFGETQHFTFLAAGADPAQQTGVVAYDAAHDPLAVPPTVLEPPAFAAAAGAGGELDEPEPAGRSRRWLLGCGCGALLVVIALALALFLLDLLAPDLLWCTRLRPLTDLLGSTLGQTVVCP